MSHQYAIRPLLATEGHVLKRFTYEAIFKRPEDGEVPFDIIYRPELRCYWEGFGDLPFDAGVAAIEDNFIIGACWARDVHGYGSLADGMPELALAVLEPYRKQGVGTGLIEAMLKTLKESGIKQASLAVQKDNPAFRIYRRAGFVVVDETPSEWLMRISL